MSELHGLVVDIGVVASSHGYQAHIVNFEDESDDLIVRFEPYPAPPPALSVSVTDGVGSADKVGG